MILSYCHTLAINIAKYKGNISLLYFLFFQLEPHSGESIWRIRPNFNSHIFSYIQWIQGVMSNTSSMPHNFISLAQGWSHCTCCSVQEDSRWQGEEGARPPHADLWAHGWDRRGAHRCARGKACWGVVGCRKGRTREPGSRELERTAPLERWTPPGNEATWGGGGEVWKGGFHLHLRPQLRLLVVAELHYLTLIKRTTMVDDDGICNF